MVNFSSSARTKEFPSQVFARFDVGALAPLPEAGIQVRIIHAGAGSTAPPLAAGVLVKPAVVTEIQQARAAFPNGLMMASHQLVLPIHGREL